MQKKTLKEIQRRRRENLEMYHHYNGDQSEGDSCIGAPEPPLGSQVCPEVNSPTAEKALRKEAGKKMDSICNESNIHQDSPEAAREPAALIYHQPEQDEEKEDELASQLKFGDQIKTLLIPGVDLRIMCHFLGLQSVNDVKNANFTNVPLVTLLLMETLLDYMRSIGYSFAGELMFNDQGNPIPVTKHAWQINDKEISFTRRGYMYFEKIAGESQDNVVMFTASNLAEHFAGLTCFSKNEKISKTILSDLDEYSKHHNCLRGSKLRNVNVLGASFDEASGFEDATWDNYYYEEQIKDVINLQIFGFLHNIEKHNKRNITKRGILVHGPAGTGKTSLGKIICNYGEGITVIWITPDVISDNERGQQSIKLLYMLSDYLSPGIVILEDMDLFSSDRETGLVNNLRLGTLMNILDGIYSIKNMVTLATTNRMEIVEQALRNRPGRFDRIVKVPALIEPLRKRMFEDKMTEFTLDDNIIESLIEDTDGWTGAEIQELINSFHMYFIQEDEEENLHITEDLAERILETMDKFSLKEGHRKERLGFGTKKAGLGQSETD